MHVFETIGNATCLVYENGAPLLVTDPWLVGTAYHGSWAHYHAPSEAERKRCAAAPFIWFSHGHPDHLHAESLALLSRDSTVLIGDHYLPEIHNFLVSQGFEKVIVCPHRKWIELSKHVRILCLSNMNQDAILVIAIGDTVIINQNDSPLLGEGRFLRKIISGYKNSYLLALCTNNADMINFTDERGVRTEVDPHVRKSGTVAALGARCRFLGVTHFCCFSSQHLYVRSDSAWANPYHICWDDMRRHWSVVSTKLVEPYVTVDLSDASITRNHPGQQPDPCYPTGTCGDDWSQNLTPGEWLEVCAYFSKFRTLRSKLEFIDVMVGTERRTVFEGRNSRRGNKSARRGVMFHVPRNSLLQTVRNGYFDDLLIGNFMKTHLVNMELYPHFAPRLAKYGDNAQVYSTAQLTRFVWHYFKRSPRAMIVAALEGYWQRTLLPRLKSALRALKLFDFIKKIYLRA